VFGTRSSPISGSKRYAANPANALLNYTYALLEAETTLALHASGLDPALGIQAHLDAFEDLQARLRKDPNDVAAHVLLSKLDPATIRLFEGTKERARESAERQLKTGMFRQGDPGNFTKIASDLSDTKRWLSHGQMIDREDAQQLGLNVTPLDPKDPEWLAFWHLYCLQRLEVKDGQTLFESDYASLAVDAPAH
jgi:hypothetical protein